MSFSSMDGNNVQYTINSDKKRLVRPLTADVESFFMRNIASCTVQNDAGQPVTIRKYRSVYADRQHPLNTMKDPLWDKLLPHEKFKQDGSRVDFKGKMMHLLPVWSYSDNDVKVIVQGNQLFTEFKKYYDTGRSITACDWSVYKKGTGRDTEYVATNMDATTFDPPISREMLGEKIKASMAQAIAALNPFSSIEDLITFVAGTSPNAAPNSFQPQQAQTALPTSQFFKSSGRDQPTEEATPVSVPRAMTHTVMETTQQPGSSIMPATVSVPVQVQPVFPPNVAATAFVPPPPHPRDIVVTTGKHSGKTLGWIQANSPAYLNVLKRSEKSLKEAIEELQADEGSEGDDTATSSVDKNSLMQEINGLCTVIPEFQGPMGMVQNLLPFFVNTIGSANIADADAPTLQKLVAALKVRANA